MGKFKNFIITEEIGLADLGLRVDTLVNSQQFDSKVNGAITAINWRAEDRELEIPSVVRQGRITTLHLKKNPIYVRLSDGTEAHFTYDEWTRIKGKPELGKTMMITFQRHPSDFSENHSKIENVAIID